MKFVTYFVHVFLPDTMSTVRKRKNLTTSNKGKSIPHSKHGSNAADILASDPKLYPPWLMRASTVVGVMAMVYCGYIHSWFMYTLHENNMWFTNIKVSVLICNMHAASFSFLTLSLNFVCMHVLSVVQKQYSLSVSASVSQ